MFQLIITYVFIMTIVVGDRGGIVSNRRSVVGDGGGVDDGSSVVNRSVVSRGGIVGWGIVALVVADDALR